MEHEANREAPGPNGKGGAIVTPKRITLSRKKGFRLQEFSENLNGLPAVNCARPGKWGNPFRVERGIGYGCGCTTPLEAIAAFDQYIHHPAQKTLLAQAAHELRGRNLACYCKENERCHCDILLKIANEVQS